VISTVASIIALFVVLLIVTIAHALLRECFFKQFGMQFACLDPRLRHVRVLYWAGLLIVVARLGLLFVWQASDTRQTNE